MKLVLKERENENKTSFYSLTWFDFLFEQKVVTQVCLIASLAISFCVGNLLNCQSSLCITAIINDFRVSLRDQALWCSVRDGWESESCVTVFPAYWYSCLSPHVSDRASVLGSANGEGEFCTSYRSHDWGSLAVDAKKPKLRRDVLERQVWSTCSTDTLVRLGLCGREWSFVLWFGRFRGKKTGKNHLCPLIVCLVHLTRSAFNRSSYMNVDKMNVLSFLLKTVGFYYKEINSSQYSLQFEMSLRC